MVTVAPGSVILGGAVTISEAIEALKKASEMDGYEYCKDMAKHWQRVANTPIRNAGTLAGNLMLKHAHREFPSDVFLLLETIGAMLTIGIKFMNYLSLRLVAEYAISFSLRTKSSEDLQHSGILEVEHGRECHLFHYVSYIEGPLLQELQGKLLNFYYLKH